MGCSVGSSQPIIAVSFRQILDAKEGQHPSLSGALSCQITFYGERRMTIDPTDPELLRDRGSLMSDPSLGPLFPELKRGIWHTTSPQGFVEIAKAGYIAPNDGRFPFTWPYKSEKSYGVLKGYVCLFDFASASEDECILQHYKWSPFFWHHDPFTVAIELDRRTLAEHLIPNSAAHAGVGYSTMWIPYVEAWHDGPISIAAAIRYLFLPRDGQPFWASPEELHQTDFVPRVRQALDHRKQGHKSVDDSSI